MISNTSSNIRAIVVKSFDAAIQLFTMFGTGWLHEDVYTIGFFER